MSLVYKKSTISFEFTKQFTQYFLTLLSQTL